jgi:hypothetical protein
MEGGKIKSERPAVRKVGVMEEMKTLPSVVLVQHGSQALVKLDDDLHAELGLGIDAINKGSDELARQVHLLDRRWRQSTVVKAYRNLS